MTIGQIYYLATICGKLYSFLFIIKFPLIIVAGLAVSYYIDTKCGSFQSDESNVAKKCMKWTVIPLAFVIITSMFVPSKEDFLVIVMTKNYTPEQVYTMTKDELKNSVDYFVNQIKELKK